MTRLRRQLPWLILVAALVLPATALGQAKRPMTIVNLLEVPQLRDPQLAPDGSQLLYVLGEADWKANRRISHIWRINVDGTAPVQLTNGEDGESMPRWSPDGRHIAFLAERGDDEHRQIYLLSNAGGEARRLTNHETGVGDITWTPDGQSLLFLAADPEPEEEYDVIVFDEDYEQEHLWRVSVTDGSEQRITQGDFSIRSYRLARDGRTIAHHRAPTPLLDDIDEVEVWLMRADGSGALRLTTNGAVEGGAEVSPDGEWVLFVADANDQFELYYNDNIFLIPAAGGPHRLLLPDLPYEVQEAQWSRDGSTIYFTANTGVRSELFAVDVASERVTQLTSGDHAVRSWSYAPSADAHLFGIDQPTNAGDVHLLPASGGEPRKVTSVYDYLDREFLLPRQEAIQWEGADGATVEGLLFYPLDYRSGRRYPLVVQTHGGPAAADNFGFGGWSDYVQVLTAKGYFVFQPNYRGSTGYGDAVLRDMVGHYFNQAHLDVMTGVDHLIAQGLVDGERMAKMGWSGGGHMTNKIITFTDRFKAASSGAGAVNWISMYAQSDVRIYRTPWFGGTPWEEDAPIDAYWEHSPLKDIARVTTPTIILVGQNDPRVPPPQSVELYRALKSNGVETHLYMAPREPHGWRELKHELFKVNVELAWWERHLMGREYTWETAPKPAGGKEGS
ncbi:MAG: S9 family peptidase [Gemmatimonadota bacterium]|nr:MAG: S9 family peptidase [Gemmatimonadota bacterium]